MTDQNRNTRTLIVSFVVAIMALIPLRFVEVGQMVSQQVQVLGEQVALPEDGFENSLEAPYAEIENQASNETACIKPEEAAGALNDLRNQIVEGFLDGDQVNELVNQMKAIEENTCK